MKMYWAYHGRHYMYADRHNSSAHGSLNKLNHRIKIAMCGPHICLPRLGLWIPRLTWSNITMIVNWRGQIRTENKPGTIKRKRSKTRNGWNHENSQEKEYRLVFLSLACKSGFYKKSGGNWSRDSCQNRKLVGEMRNDLWETCGDGILDSLNTL